ncbi:hypothetical protein IW261DRAFT_1417716 [Armillaria novae-zelandiae]|uniref:Uncharacterized protein n=1 Tax=Armillaria novae-zelandiae TaxID=153914 RepID=A0AA39PGV7_9AGAR|nr:hypothetical protein IW261DRAFT_1417716 [Armillaria novae-zelandiae]
MSVATPTVLPRDPRFPHLLPPVPRIRPMQLRNVGYEAIYGRMKDYRDLQRELDELSEEERELENLDNDVRNRGFGSIIPIGRFKTVQEEKREVDDAEDGEEDSMHSDGPPSVVEEEDEDEEDESADMDASMQDMDASLQDMDEDEEPEESSDAEDFLVSDVLEE